MQFKREICPSKRIKPTKAPKHMKTALNQPLKSSTFPPPPHTSAVDLFRSMWKGWGLKVVSLLLVVELWGKPMFNP